MSIGDAFTTAVSSCDQFNQRAELDRLRDLTRKVAARKHPRALHVGIDKFLKMDLLRYGVFSESGKRGFGVVRHSDGAWDFIRREILPTDQMSAVLLSMLLSGSLAVEADHSRGQADFAFCRTSKHLGTEEEVVQASVARLGRE